MTWAELPRFRKWKLAVLHRDNWECSECGRDFSLTAYPIFSCDDYPEWRFILENGIALCNICYQKVNLEPDFVDHVINPADRILLKKEFMRGVGTIIE